MSKRNIIGLVLILFLIAGLVIATRLTQIQQIFHSKASAGDNLLDTSMQSSTKDSRLGQNSQQIPGGGHYVLSGTVKVSVDPKIDNGGITSIGRIEASQWFNGTWEKSLGVISDTQTSPLTFDVPPDRLLVINEFAANAQVDFTGVSLKRVFVNSGGAASGTDSAIIPANLASGTTNATRGIGGTDGSQPSQVRGKTFRLEGNITGQDVGGYLDVAEWKIVNGQNVWLRGHRVGEVFTVGSDTDFIQAAVNDPKNVPVSWSGARLMQVDSSPGIEVLSSSMQTASLGQDALHGRVDQQSQSDPSWGQGEYTLTGTVTEDHSNTAVYRSDIQSYAAIEASQWVVGADGGLTWEKGWAIKPGDSSINISIPAGRQLVINNIAYNTHAVFNGVSLVRNNLIPLPSTVSYPAGSVTCDANNKGTFSWSAINYPGKTVSEYELRINAAPAGWGPDTTTPPDQPAVVQRADAGPDRIINVDPTQTSMTVQLNPGQYLDWVARPHFTDGTMLDTDQPTAWGHWGGWTCGGTAPSPSNPASPSPSASSTGVTPVGYKLSTTQAGLDSAAQQAYTTAPFDYTFTDSTPGIKTLFVRFIYSDGSTVDTQKSITYTPDNPPTITGVTCAVDPNIQNGTVVTIVGSNFGTTAGTVTYGGNTGLPIMAGQWADGNITAQFPSQLQGSQTVVVTTSGGRTTSGTCVLNQSQISANVQLACRTVNRPPVTAVAKILDAKTGAQVYVNNSVTFGNDGSAQNILPSTKLTPGGQYVLTINSNYTLTRAIPFTASTQNTTVLTEDPVKLPLGDLNADGAINTNDYSIFRTQISQLQDVGVKQADFNVDGRINSADYSCLLSNLGKSSDIVVTNVSPLSPSPSVSPTPAGG